VTQAGFLAGLAGKNALVPGASTIGAACADRNVGCFVEFSAEAARPKEAAPAARVMIIAIVFIVFAFLGLVRQLRRRRSCQEMA
jgi:hypothetical protein